MTSTDTFDTIDPETLLLLEIRLKSKKREASNNLVEDEDEDEDEDEFGWDNYKENVRPLKRGRNVKILNYALKCHSSLPLKHSLLHSRRKLIEAIDEYQGDDPLLPWLRCIKWVQEAFPAGGDSSGLVLIYEQCVRTFWHDDRYKDDRRYLRVWLDYAESCADAEIIYKFMDANKIGQSHSAYYISYALHLESKHKTKTANEIFNRGLSMDAQPREKLEAAYRKFLARSMARPKPVTDEDGTENIQTEDGTKNIQTVRSFGTVLFRGENRRNLNEVSEVGKKNTNGNRGKQNPLSVYKDNNMEKNSGHPVHLSKQDSKSWDSLPSHKDRNKENTAIPAKWTSFKVPQKPGTRLAGPVAPAIEVFVDERCSELQQDADETEDSTNVQLKERDGRELKRESELLKENPLRNFPMSSFPR